jgi:hypothetical protein
MKPYLVTFTADIAVYADSVIEARRKADEQLEEFCVVVDYLNIQEWG